MQFTYIHIKKLFGLYDYSINFDHEDDSKLTILTGPNGSGKTTILTILNNLSPEKLYYFYILKFDEINVGLNDNTSIHIFQRIINDDIENKSSDIRKSLAKEVRFEWQKSDGTQLCYFIYNLSNINKAKKIFAFRQMHRMYDYELKRNDDKINKILQKNKFFNEYIAHSVGQDIFILQLESLRTCFIHANRIYNEANEENEELPIQKVKRTLQKKLLSLYRDFLEQSQRIDSRFVKDVINQVHREISEDCYEKLANEVTLKQNELVKFRLTDKIEIPKYDNKNCYLLYSYLNGLSEKYDRYGTLPEKLSLLDKLLTAKRFSNKRIVFSPQHGFQIISNNGDILDESLLSSGEQNEIVLLYKLIFDVNDKSTLLIDEPENSLHVVWQRAFWDDMKEIAESKDLQVIIATHSISIVSKGAANSIDLYYLLNN